MGILLKLVHYKATEKERFTSPIYIKLLVIGTLSVLASALYGITRLSSDRNFYDDILLPVFATFSLCLSFYLIISSPKIKSLKTINDLGKVIYERINIEHKIIAKNEQLEWAEKAARICHADWDLTKDTIKFSDNARSILGLDPRQTFNVAHITTMIHPEDRDKLPLITRISYDGKPNNRALFRMLISNETRYVQVIGEAVKDSENAIYVRTTFQDVTEQQLFIRKIEEKNKVLQQIAQVQSHDVRGPITTMLGLIDVFKNANLPEEDIKTALDGIKECADKLDTIIQTMATQSNAMPYE